MNLREYIFRIFPRIVNYKLARYKIVRPTSPITLTFSITAACNSLCKTCNIGLVHSQNPHRVKENLTLDEIEKIFQTVGHIYFFNISGGEPFMRNDFPDIVELACKYLKPRIIHSPTNALLPQKVYEGTKRSLEIINRYDPKIEFSIKPSIDGVGAKHDEVRGVPGNFKKLEETIQLLKKFEKHPNFHIELGTVISRYNINDLDAIEDYVHSIGIQSYRNEIAEQRTEFFNLNDPITPSAEEYQKLMERFKKKIKENIKGKKRYARITEAFRLVYYDLVPKILKGKNIPCYAGISNVHINFNGEVWPCCVLGYDKPMGNLRDFNYDFNKMWHSKKANQVRKFIRINGCPCPLANQAYSNILCNFRSMLKVIAKIIHLSK